MAAIPSSPESQCSSSSSNQQRSHINDFESASIPPSLANLDALFDPNSTPTIYLGPLAIPGPLLPILISVVFITYKFRQFNARRNRSVQLGIEQLPPTPGQNSLQWPDLRHPDAPRIYGAKANLAFHGVITHGAMLHFGRSFLATDVLCCVEVIALLFYAEVVKPEVRKSCLAAAVGWTLFIYLDRLEDGVATLVVTGLVVVLAAPLAWQVDGIRGEVELQQSVPGLLLMLMAAYRVCFDSEVAAQRWAKDSRTEAFKCISMLHVVNGLMMWVFNRNGETRLRDTRRDPHQMSTTLRRWVGVALKPCVLLTVLIGIHAGGILCTAYLTSCLPWSRFLFGRCASSPSLSGLALLCGSSMYSSIFTIMESLRQYRSRGRADRTTAVAFWGQLEVGANVIGWAVLFMNTLYVALEIFL